MTGRRCCTGNCDQGRACPLVDRTRPALADWLLGLLVRAARIVGRP